MKGKITKRTVDGLQPSAKDQFLWDTDVLGFGLKVTPTGRKIYCLQYFLHGKVKRYTIGHHGQPWTPEAARDHAREKRSDSWKGVDPNLEKARENAIPKLWEFGQRYLTEYAELHKKPRSVAEDRRNLEKLVYPDLGSRRLNQITRQDITRLHNSLREKPIAANRTLAVLSTMFNLAERWGYLGTNSNPCRHVPKYKEQKRERYLSETELAQLGTMLAKVEKAHHYSLFVTAAIRLLILLGARLNEVLTLKWEQIDLDRRCAYLPDSKTGQKTVYLNAPTVQVLEDLPRISGNPYVLPGHKIGTHLRNIQTAWRDIRRQANIEDVRIHDLRHSFASMGAGMGLGLPILGALLGHTQAATTHRYAHLSADPLKQAAEVIGERLNSTLSRKPSSATPRRSTKKRNPEKGT